MAPQILAETCPHCEVSAGKVEAYNDLLELSDDEREEAISTHLPWGMPREPNGAAHEHLLYQYEYIINYDDDLRIPIWTAYRLTRGDLEDTVTRKDCFRLDPRLSDEQSASCEDYAGSGFDRGHMARSNDMARSEDAMINTFVLSNMCPQFPNFNRQHKPWNTLENIVQLWARDRERIYLFTGAVFDRDNDGRRDRDEDAKRIQPEKRVAIPSHFFKIVLYERPNGFIESLAVLLPHRNSWPGNVNDFVRSRITSIKEIESITGVDFLPELEEPRKTAVKNFVAPSLFPIEEHLFNLALSRSAARESQVSLPSAREELPVQIDALSSRLPSATVPSEGQAAAPSAKVDQPGLIADAAPRAAGARYAIVPSRTGGTQFFLVDLWTGNTWAMLSRHGEHHWQEIRRP